MKTTRCVLFEGLSDEEIAFVTEKLKFKYRTFPRGEQIFVYGKNDGKAYCLVDGAAETLRTDENGTTALIERISVGEVFGYGANNEFSGRDYAVITAESKCTVGIADVSEVDLSELPPVFLKNFVKAQQKRIAAYAARTNVLLGRTMRDKLICYFKNCAEEAGSNVFYLNITLTRLADLIFADRTAMMREIKKLREDGIVKIDRRKVTIV